MSSSAARRERRAQARVAQQATSTAIQVPKFEVRFATTDEDVVRIHRFVAAVSAPIVLAPVDPIASIVEMRHIVVGSDEDTEPYGFALVAEIDGEIIGSLGLVRATWWYNPKVRFFTDRWFFTFPALANAGIGPAMLAQAASVAAETEIPIVINGKLVRRARNLPGGLFFTTPRVIRGPADVEQ